MLGYLLDTNHVSAAIAPVSSLRELIHRKRRSGIRIGTCVPVLCEAEAGIQQTADPAAYARRLSTLLAHVSVWPLEIEVGRIFGGIFNRLKKMGKALSQVDMMEVALAMHMDLTIVTTDKDFGAIPEVRAENWL